jgi:hypothetical protein
VGDEHLNVVWDQGPLRRDLGTSMQIERPVEEPRLPRRPPETNAVDHDARVSQVRDAGRDQRLDSHGLALVRKIVVAGHEHLRAMRRFFADAIKDIGGVTDKLVAAALMGHDEDATIAIYLSRSTAPGPPYGGPQSARSHTAVVRVR